MRSPRGRFIIAVSYPLSGSMVGNPIWIELLPPLYAAKNLTTFDSRVSSTA